MIIEYMFWDNDEAIILLRNADLTPKKQNIMKHKNVLSHIKMSKEIITFGDIAIKHKFYRYKSPIF